MATKRLPNFSMFLSEKKRAKIEKIQEQTGISTIAGVIIYLIMNYKLKP